MRSTLHRQPWRLFVLALLLSGLAWSSESRAADCKVASFSRKPISASSSVWSRSDLVVLDNARHDLLLFGNNGQAKGAAYGALAKSLNDLRPLGMARRGDGLTGDGRILIQSELNRFLVLTPDYTFEGSVDVLSRPTSEGSSIERIYSWAPTWSATRKDIVAFADLKKGDQWSTGVVRFPVDFVQGAQGWFLKNLSVNEPSRKFHRLGLGYSYIASLQDQAYVMLMDNGFRLWRSDGAGRFIELPRFNETFPVREVPVLPAFIRPTDYAPLMGEIEKAEMPTAIYGWKGELYVLWRRPVQGTTNWFLSRLRPTDGELLSTIPIPSHSSHLLAVPGEENWAFIEKGAVLGLQNQEVRSVLNLPAADLRGALASRQATTAEAKRGDTGAVPALCRRP